MDDQSGSGEGGTPEQTKPVRQRRSRKLSGPQREAMGELAFILYTVAAYDAVSDTRWQMLRAKLLAWRARFI